MEHRQGSRLPLVIQIEIRCRANEARCTRTLNVSRRGMLVQTQGCPLRLYDVVDVVFPRGTEGDGREARYKAFVVHSDETCAGLMLTAGNIDLEQLADVGEDATAAVSDEPSEAPLISGALWKSVA